MSELSNKIRAVRGNMSAEEAGAKAGISRESFYRIERGGSVKLDTLRQIAKAFSLTDAEWLDILVAWLKNEVADDARKLWIESRDSQTSPLRDAETDQVTKAMLLFKDLNPDERHQILLTLERPEVRRSLPALNKLYDSLRKQ